MARVGRSAILICLAAVLDGLSAAPGRTHIYPAPMPLSALSFARDHNGLIWIAAMEGVFRFDGLHFHAIPGYPFRDARFVAAEPGGAVWAGGPQGLARYENSVWKALLLDPVEAMALGPAGLWVNAGGLRLISAGNAERRFAGTIPTGELLVDGKGALWFPCGENVCTMRPPHWRLESQRNPARGKWQKLIPERDGQGYWMSTASEVALVDAGQVRSRQEAPHPGITSHFPPLLDPDRSPEGTVWGTRGYPQPMAGLRFWQVAAFFEDCSLFTSESTRWVCVGDKVGKSIRQVDWETWAGGPFTSRSPEGFLLHGGDTPLLYSSRGALVLQGDRGYREMSSGNAKLDIVNMIEDGHGGYWLATRDEGLVRAGKSFNVMERFSNLCPSIDTMRALLRDGEGRTWVGGKLANCFFEVRGGPGKWNFVPQKLPDGALQTASLLTDRQGRPWVGYDRGIAYLDDSGNWRKVATSESLTSVRSFEFDGDHAIWVTHRRPGYFTRLERRGAVWQVRRFDPGTPSQTLYLRRDSRGWIWRGTLTDVQIARPGRYLPGDWLRLSALNGMASSGVSLRGWYEDGAGNVWLAGNGGVTRTRPNAAWFDAPKHAQPIVTRVTVGTKTWLDPDRIPSEFADSGEPLEIDLSAIDANAFSKAPMRYRLTPTYTEWQSSMDGRLKFDRLANGSYLLEAAYNGEGTPEILHWTFQIGNPGTRFVVPALSLGALGLLAPWGWRRKEWLQYWVHKRAFLATRLWSRNHEVLLAETNYTGRTLAHRYQVFDPLSRGGFSVTYLALDRQTNQKVVVKVLNRTPGQERWMRHRFAHEVAALHALDHPGVVPLLDSWISPEGEPCLAMQFLDGPTLRHVLKEERRLDPVRVARIVEQLGDAVGAIHQRGIVHRDLKPENLIVLGKGEQELVVVIDFGTSAARGPENEQEHTTTLTGSLHYLAPERLAGQYSPASDVYSIAVMVLEMVTGMRPAEIDGPPGQPEFLQAVGERTGRAAAEKIALALQHQPGRRPPDASAWAGEVAKLLRTFSESRQDGSPST